MPSAAPSGAASGAAARRWRRMMHTLGPTMSYSQRVKACFEMLDTTGTGSLGIEDLAAPGARETLRGACGVKLPESAAEVMDFFAKLAPANTLRLGFGEFARAVAVATRRAVAAPEAEPALRSAFQWAANATAGNFGGTALPLAAARRAAIEAPSAAPFAPFCVALADAFSPGSAAAALPAVDADAFVRFCCGAVVAAANAAAADAGEARGGAAAAAARAFPKAELDVVRRKLRAASYTSGGMDAARLFERMDRDRSGSLDAVEFLSAVRRVLQVPRDVVSDSDVSRLLAVLDADGDGDVSVAEFVNFVGGGGEAAAARDGGAAPVKTALNAWDLGRATRRASTATGGGGAAAAAAAPQRRASLGAPPTALQLGTVDEAARDSDSSDDDDDDDYDRHLDDDASTVSAASSAAAPEDTLGDAEDGTAWLSGVAAPDRARLSALHGSVVAQLAALGASLGRPAPFGGPPAGPFPERAAAGVVTAARRRMHQSPGRSDDDGLLEPIEDLGLAPHPSAPATTAASPPPPASLGAPLPAGSAPTPYELALTKELLSAQAQLAKLRRAPAAAPAHGRRPGTPGGRSALAAAATAPAPAPDALAPYAARVRELCRALGDTVGDPAAAGPAGDVEAGVATAERLARKLVAAHKSRGAAAAEGIAARRAQAQAEDRAGRLALEAEKWAHERSEFDSLSLETQMLRDAYARLKGRHETSAAGAGADGEALRKSLRAARRALRAERDCAALAAARVVTSAGGPDSAVGKRAKAAAGLAKAAAAAGRSPQAGDGANGNNPAASASQPESDTGAAADPDGSIAAVAAAAVAAVEEASALRRTVEAAERRAEAAEGDVASLAAQLAAAEGKTRRALLGAARQRHASDDVTDALHAEGLRVASLKNCNAALAAENAALEAELGAARAAPLRVTVLEAEVAKLTDEAATANALRDEARAERERRATAEAGLADARRASETQRDASSEATGLRAELRKARREAAELSARLSGADASAAEVEALRASRDEALRAAEELRGEASRVHRLEAELLRLRQADARGQERALKQAEEAARLQALVREGAQAVDVARVAEGRCDDLEEQLHASEALCSELDGKSRDMNVRERQLKDAKHAIGQLEMAHETANAHVRRMTVQLGGKERELALAQARAGALDEEGSGASGGEDGY